MSPALALAACATPPAEPPALDALDPHRLRWEIVSLDAEEARARFALLEKWAAIDPPTDDIGPQAISAIGRSRHPRAREVLEEILASRRLRVFAVHALDSLGEPEGCEALVALWMAGPDEDPLVDRAVFDALVEPRDDLRSIVGRSACGERLWAYRAGHTERTDPVLAAILAWKWR